MIETVATIFVLNEHQVESLEIHRFAPQRLGAYHASYYLGPQTVIRYEILSLMSCTNIFWYPVEDRFAEVFQNDVQ